MPNEFIARNGLISLSSVQVTGSTSITGSLTLNGSPVILSSQTSSIALTSGQVTTALGYTPYNSTNPSGYTSNTGTVTSVAGAGSYGGLTLTGTVTTTGNITLGGTPTGTWPISVSGNAATVSSITNNTALIVDRLTPASNVDGLTSTNFRTTLFGTSTNGGAIATARWNSVPTGISGMNMYGTMFAWAGSDTHGFIATDYSVGNIQVGGGSGNNISWKVTLLHSSNYNSYSPTLTGTGASGTWGINVTGTAGSISGFGNPTTSATGNTIVYRDPNGYVFGNYINLTDDGNPGSGTAITSFITKQGDNYYRSVSPTNAMVSIRGVASGTWGISISGGIEATQASLGYSVSGVNIDYGGHGGPQIRSQGGGAAMMSFHRPGSYAINFGLGTDNQLRTGGWSRGGNYVILDSGNYTSYSPSLTGGGASGTWGINITGLSEYSKMDYLMSIRDFADGTLVQTSINYAVTYGDPFILEIKGNSYASNIPFDIQIQGYIYSDTIINTGGYSNGTNISGIRAINYNGNLCFWWPRQAYWQGFTVKVYTAYDGRQINKVTSISNSTQPTTAKQVNFTPIQTLNSSNYNSYTPTLTGAGASGTWGINITGTSSNITAYSINQNLSTTSGPTFGDVYNNGWFRNYGATGVYNQSYGSHFRVSTNASHGTWEMFGYSKNGYAGLNIIDSSGYWNNHMFEGGNGGVYQENGAGWLWYYNRTYGSFTIGGATVSASYKLYVQGSIYATGVVDWASDVRKKENIVTIDNSLEKVTKLRGVYFNRIDDPNKKTQTGVIAQEVKEIMPELVNYDDMNDSYSVTYGNFAGLFIEAIKEQQKLIESQQKQIDELKSIVNNLNK